MNKIELRKKYINIRNNIKDRDIKNDIIYHKIINDKDIIKCKKLMLYYSINSEVDTIKIINYFINKKEIYLPRCNNNEMEFYKLNSINDLKSGMFNIMEPISNEYITTYDDTICIVPGICFDLNNYRIGYGRGYYDKYLHNKNIDTIGITYSDTLIENIEYDDNDIKLRRVISDKYES